jgi:hypothetical protein
MLDGIYQEYLKNTNRSFAFVSSDQQVWIKLFYLTKKQPEKYSWIIPLPGK